MSDADDIVPIAGAVALDVDEVERLLFEHDGDVRLVALDLHVRSDRVRRFINSSGQLRRAQDEVYERGVDEAIGVLFAALRDKHSFQNRFYGAKEFLRSAAGRKRGFGHVEPPAASVEVRESGGARTIVLKWIDPDPPSLSPTIEGEKAE